MSRSKNKMKEKKKLIVAVELVCLVVLALGAYRVIADRINSNEPEIKTKTEPKTGEFLILVNNENAIPDGYLDKITIVETDGGYEIDERIADDLETMLEDCRNEGYSPQIISGFRTRETQEYLYDRTANKSDTAVPGHSEHECGLAVDIIDADSAGWADPLIDEQEEMPAQKWLMENCRKYGFILRYPKDKEDITEIIYEPWHYRYVGREHAEEIMEKGICLEEYVDPDRYSGKGNE